MDNQTPFSFTSRVKNPQTYQQKVITKRKAGRQYAASDVNDTYGGRIVVPNNQAKLHVLAEIQALSKYPNAPFRILAVQNVDKDTYHATHIDIQTHAGTRGEIQIQTPGENAESLVNHSIRAQWGENPPDQLNKVKKKNAKLIGNLNPQQQLMLAQRAQALHKVNPQNAATLPINLAKGIKH